MSELITHCEVCGVGSEPHWDYKYRKLFDKEHRECADRAFFEQLEAKTREDRLFREDQLLAAGFTDEQITTLFDIFEVKDEL